MDSILGIRNENMSSGNTAHDRSTVSRFTGKVGSQDQALYTHAGLATLARMLSGLMHTFLGLTAGSDHINGRGHDNNCPIIQILTVPFHIIT